MPHLHSSPVPGLPLLLSYSWGLSGCGVASGRVSLLSLVLRSVQDLNLRSSDYQKRLPDSAGHDGTVLLTRSDTSRQYVLLPDGDGCFR